MPHDDLLTDSTATAIRIRAVRPDDAPRVAGLLGALSDDDRYRRWFTGAVDLPRAALWAAHPETQDAVGLLAFADEEIVGHAVLVPDGQHDGELAFEVAPAWRHHGVAGALLAQLRAAGRARGLRTVHADVLAENADMLAVLHESGPSTEQREAGVIRVTLALDRAA